MALEGPAEWAVFMDTDAFGEPVTLAPVAGGTVALPAIFTAAHVEFAQGNFPGVSGSAPVAVVSAFDLPAPVLAGDGLTARGRAFRVTDVQPDATGMVRLILEEV